MIRKSWRSRFVSRLVADVSRSAVERAAAHPRLFPYGITDGLADPFQPHRRVRLALPEVREQPAPKRQQSVWHYVKR